MHKWKVLTILAGSLLASNNILAADPIRFLSHGTFEFPSFNSLPPDNSGVGELVNCGAPPGRVLRISWIFDRFEGVCDDLGDTPCAGRLVAIQEGCTGDNDANVAGLIRTTYFRGGKIRICWDESATGQCTAEYEVATGEELSGQNQGLLGAPTTQGITVTEISKGSEFLVDGEAVRIKKSTSVSHRVFENSPDFDDPNHCILPVFTTRAEGPCGISVIAIRADGGSAND